MYGRKRTLIWTRTKKIFKEWNENISSNYPWASFLRSTNVIVCADIVGNINVCYRSSMFAIVVYWQRNGIKDDFAKDLVVYEIKKLTSVQLMKWPKTKKKNHSAQFWYTKIYIAQFVWSIKSTWWFLFLSHFVRLPTDMEQRIHLTPTTRI